MPHHSSSGSRIREFSADTLDERILWELFHDANITNTALAQRLHVSASTTLTRVKALREAGLLGRARSEVDLAAVGLPLQAIVAVRLRVQARADLRTFADRVARLPHVLNVFFLGGQTDFLVHVATTSPEQLRDLVSARLSTDPAVASTETQIVFDWRRGADYRGPSDSFDTMRAPID